MSSSPEQAQEEAGASAPLPLLAAPADGIPRVVVEESELVAAATSLCAGCGPVAVDAERASGYRYGQRAYLVQVRRSGAGTTLIDPIACPDLSPVNEALRDAEWVVHASTQDLPCLAEVGLRPTRLFDTELGARLAGLPRVGLAAVVEHYLGLSLAKEHSAVDWSTRPLPEPWLRYAALDVEVLVEVRDAIEADLADQGKLDWALEEFDALTSFLGPPVRVDPWRRTSGMHKVRTRRSCALVRELWLARDGIARTRDISPGRILPDPLLMQIAVAAPRTAAALKAVSTNRSLRRYQGQWLQAVDLALGLPEAELPPHVIPAEGPPPMRSWADRDPVAAARLIAVRATMAAFAAQHKLPVENVLSPDVLRRVIWQPPPPDDAAVAAALSGLGARPWQVRFATPMILSALASATSTD
ncbi:MAG TPA: HRDC domain-containing protein [Dermatophilaceae bacterium]|nr:HRDC domain-containing protein [Dermatophilaceae bacterium]